MPRLQNVATSPHARGTGGGRQIADHSKSTPRACPSGIASLPTGKETLDADFPFLCVG